MDLRTRSGHRVFHPSRHGLLAYFVQHSGEIFSEPRIRDVTGLIFLAIFGQLVKSGLRCAGKVKRHTIRESDQAGKISAPHMFSMTTHVDLRGIRSERAGIDVNLVVAHRAANLIDVIGEVRRGVLAQVVFFL